MIHVFLDTNVLFEDYFFEKYQNRKLLNYCIEGLVSLYMSNVVILELRKQFLDEINEKNRYLKRVSKDSKRLRIETALEQIDVAKAVQKFDDFYQGLTEVPNFKVIDYKNEHLPYIVDRAIYRKKPFTQDKNELKDALIWKSYSEFVMSLSMATFIFLTLNHTDFCDKGDISKIHPDLIVDTDRFRVIGNSFEFVRQYASQLESPEHRINAFLQRQKISNDYISEFLYSDFESLIEDRIRDEVSGLNPSDILDDEFWHDGYIADGDIQILDCEDGQFEKLTNSLLISGKTKALCNVQVYEYNSVRDPGDEMFDCIDDTSITFEVAFSFVLSFNEDVSDFEFIRVNLVRQAGSADRI